MSPYEPKTDSREFEVANPGQGNPAAGEVRVDSTDIAIRLWGLQSRGQTGTATWKADSVCVFMIADLIGASGGRIEEAGAMMAAHFDNAGQALVASRRIQAALLEFLAATPSQTAGAAILIHPAQSAAAGFTTETVRVTMSHARPGQILLAEQVAKRWADLPGLEFRAASVMGSGIGQPGLVELIWTTSEELARLQLSVPDDSATPKSQTLSMGATMMAQSPFTASRREVPGQSKPPATGTRDFSAGGESVGGGRSGNPLLQEIEENPPFLTRTKMIVGVVVLVLVGALIAVMYWPMPESKHRIRVQDETVNSGANPARATPANTTPAVTTPANADTAVTPVQTKTAEPEKKPPVVTKPPKKQVIPPVSPPITKPDQLPTIDGSSAWSKSDIPQLLRMAQSAQGEGRYDDARAAYRKILQLQPDNQDAKEGLHKIDLIKSDRDN